MRLFRGAHWVLGFGLASALRAGAAGVDVPSLELYTRGTADSGTVVLQTEGEMELAVSGGVKFGGDVTLGFTSQNLEQELPERLFLGGSSGVGLTFRSASVTIRDLFSTPLAFTYFVGESDELGSGAAFTDVFGAAPVATQYRGFLYFPDSWRRYDSIHTVAGTGMKLSLQPADSAYYAAVYAYQDGYFYDTTAPGTIEFEPGRYSVDVHSLADYGKIKLEAFLGATAPISDYGYYRGGILFHASDTGGEFLAEIGVPQWDPAHFSTGLDLFFILFEARLYLGLVSLVPTVFVHPGYYLQNPTGEAGLVDFNVSMRVGDRSGSLVSGGLESNIAFKREDLQDLEIRLSPFLGAVTAGAVWQLKVNVQVFPSIDLETFVGVKAEF
jgi:hypothetical protein